MSSPPTPTNRRVFRTLVPAAVLAGFAVLLGRSGIAHEITVDRILSGELSARAASVRFTEDGLGTLKTAPAPGGRGRDIVLDEIEGGGRRVIVAAKDLLPEGASEPLSVADYRFSADRRRVLLFTNTRRVWRRHTRGDYWVLDRESGALARLGGDAPEASLMFAKFSPEGGRVAYVCGNDIFVQSLEDLSIVRLTEGGSRTLFHGTGDWVYEEEFGLRDGFRWSPDGEWIAYFEIDDQGVADFPLVDNLRRPYPEVRAFPHPKPGTTNPACRVRLVRASGGDPLTVELPGSPRDHLIATMQWLPAGSGGALLLQRLDRRQHRRWIIEADPREGRTRVVFEDEDEAWIDAEPPVVLSDGRFLVLSERDGWRHAYLVDPSGGEARLVTRGNHDVISLDHVDEGGGWLYYSASPEDPTERHLYRVSLSGGPGERVTPDGATGTHSYEFSPDGRFAVHTASSFGVPPRTDLVRMPSHEVVRVLEDNAGLRSTLADLPRGPSEFFRVEIEGGVELDGWMIHPPEFDENRRYPVLVYVYGEPAGQTVLDRWGGRTYLWHLLLAERGLVVVSIDNRGTPAPRGRAFRKAAYRKIGITASEDQAAALRRILSDRPYLDADRVGIWGWSGGGSMTLNQLFRHPDLYHTGIAIAFVADQRLYDTIYQERYMDLPEDNPEGYEQGSPVTHAKNLRGNLLLVYGTGDDNTHYQNMEVLVDELVAHGKTFRMMAYPNRRHGLTEGLNTQRHLYSMMESFLIEHLLPDTPER